MHPVLFKFFGIEIISYGVALGLSFLTVLILSALRARKEGIEPSLVIDAFLWIFIGAILGSRLFLLIKNPSHFLIDPLSILKLWKGGFSSLGGLLGGGLVLIVFLKSKRKPILNFLDLIAPYLALGFAIQKFLGCLMAGCCYGKPTNLPWGIVFNDPRSRVPVELLGVPLHPTQIYEVLLGLAIFLILIFIRSSKFSPFKKLIPSPLSNISSPLVGEDRGEGGHRILLFLILFSGVRFLTDFFRGDQIQKYFEVFSLNQLIFGLVFLLSLIIYITRSSRLP